MFLYGAYTHWRNTRTMRLGAGLAYYALFAVIPLLSVAAAFVAWLVSSAEAESFVAEALNGLVDADVDQVAASIVDSVTRSAGELGLVGFIALLVTASFFFLALQDALNVIWEAPVIVGFFNSMRRRMLSIGVVLVVALFFVSTFVIQAVIGLAERLIPGDIEILESVASLLTGVGSWAVGIFTLALLYHVLPYVTVRWRDALVGGAITAVFVVLGTVLIGAYLSRFAPSSLSGAVSSIALFLVWVYYEAQILLGGAVLTKALGDRGAATEEAPNAAQDPTAAAG